MTPINLSLPGRLHVEDAGDAYRVYAHRFGNLEIERILDGATVFLQGDDAGMLLAKMGGVGKFWALDDLCAEYDDVLTLREDA